ncbi:MAG: hypothetical protein JG764_1468 [Clostridiales bacterium]|jgi:hypothetical protein|nr:hypothetical protein [Clostridiales bacterium]
MTDVVERTGMDVEGKSFPWFIPGMILGALLAGLGLFLIVEGWKSGSPAIILIGFIFFLIGVIIFAF